MDEVQELEQERDRWLEKFTFHLAISKATKKYITKQKAKNYDLEEQEKTKTLDYEKLKKFVEESKKKSKMIRELLPLLESTANNTNRNEEGDEIVFEELLTKRFGARNDECANPGFLKEIEDLKEQQEVTQKEIKELEDKILKSDQSNLKQKNDLKFLENDKTVEVRKIQQENAIKGEKIAQIKQEIQAKKNIIAEFNQKYNTFEHTLQAAGQSKNVKQGQFLDKDTQRQKEILSVIVPYLNSIYIPDIPGMKICLPKEIVDALPPQTPHKMELASGLTIIIPETFLGKPIDAKISKSQESLGVPPKKIRRLTDSVGYSVAAHTASNKIQEQEMTKMQVGNFSGEDDHNTEAPPKTKVEKQNHVPEKKPQPSPTSPQDSFATGSDSSFNMGNDFGNESIKDENNTSNFDDFGSNVTTKARKRTRNRKAGKCDECNLFFSRQENVVRHIHDVHTKERPYKCPYCDHTSKRKDHYQKHMQTHEKSRKSTKTEYTDEESNTSSTFSDLK